MMAGIGRGYARALTIPRAPKSSLNGRLLLGTAAIALLAQPAHANPAGGTVSTGSASISSSSNKTTVDQKSEGVVINWSSFNIGSGQTTNFVQPNSSAIAVNRIGSASASQILGTLDANGRIVLINGNGLLIGKGAHVNVGSLIATSTDGSDSDVLSGKFTKAGNQNASVVNRGTITAAGGGTVALAAPNVSNSGIVSAKLGTVSLGAANVFTVDFSGDGLVSFAAQGDVNGKATAANTGRLSGANVSMTAHAAEGLATGVVDAGGIIQAQSVHRLGGLIVLDAGGSGSIDVSNAKLEANGADGGGTIAIGSWNDASVTVNVGSILSASATKSGSGGNIKVVSNTTSFAGNALATGGILGGNGGTIETSGHTLAFAGSHINASAAHGKSGIWLLDPDDLDIDSASAATIDSTLNGDTAVELQTTASGTSGPGTVNTSGVGDINIDNEISWSTNAALIIDAYHSINVNAPIAITGAGQLELQYNDGASNGALSFGLNSEGFTGNISYGPTNNGGTLTIDSQSYKLEYSIASLATDISNGPAGNFALANSYNAGGDGTYSTAPITTTFTGTFNGLGNTVSNLTINDPAIQNVGLFAKIGTGGTVGNIGLVGGSVTDTGTDDQEVGSLAGENDGIISDSYASTHVNSGNDGYSGGLVGYNLDLISNSYATGTVSGGSSGDSYAGGLVGENDGTITGVYASGAVSGGLGDNGGLVGHNAGMITDAYATGAVLGGSDNYVGGLAGFNDGTITDVYATGAVSGSGSSEIGGLIGYANGGSVTHGYWDQASTGASAGFGGGTDTSTEVTTAQLANSTTLAALNSGGTAWGNVGNQITPYLLGNPGPVFLGTDSSATPKVYNPILNVQQLQAIGNSLGANYVLVQNIDATGYAGFVPIGESTAFSGIFDGLGNTISNLTITTSPYYAGLFGQTSGTIENIGLLGGSVIDDASPFAGALAGENDGTIADAYATGAVSGGYLGYAGGLVGYNQGSIANSWATGAVTGGMGGDIGGLAGFNASLITDSWATGAVSGYTAVGGLVGDNGGTIMDAYATGAVTGGAGAYVGGLVGDNEPFVTITDAYATGTVTGGAGASVGGLVGYNYDDSTITNVYAAGAVTGGSSSAVGGLVGINYGAITGGYWDEDRTGRISGVGSNAGTGDANALSISGNDPFQSPGYRTFTFTTTPGAQGNAWVMVDLDGTLNNNGDPSGNGPEGGTLPMLAFEYSTTITNAHQLQLMAMNPGATYTLAHNIDASATGSSTSVSTGTDVWGPAGFIAVGGNNASNFTGTFNGAGYTIANLTINTNASYAGLFGNVGSTGTIENVGLVGGSVTDTYNGADTGGAVGYNNGTISNVSETGPVASSGGDFGGLVGLNNNGALTNVSASGSVTGVGSAIGSGAGGLVGLNYGAITGAYATGVVSLASEYGDAGGLMGLNYGVIANIYATGSVTNTGYNGYAGGLIGQNQNVDSGSVANAYATGAVLGGDNSYVGGLIGLNYEPVSNSYAIGTVTGGSGQYAYVGGSIGLNYGAITNAYATGAVTAGSDAYVGGFAGSSGQAGSITDAYETGSVTDSGGGAIVGGFAGQNYQAALKDVYAVGLVSASGSTVGGLIAENESGGTVTDGYWDTGTTGQPSSVLGSSKNTAALQSALPTFVNPASWGIIAGKSYPYLCFQFAGCTETPQAVSGTVYNGTSAVEGESVSLLLNGVSVTPTLETTSGADGYYYLLLAPGTISAGGSNALAYLESGTPANTWVQNATGSIGGVNLIESDFVMASAASDSNAILSGLSAALGSASGPQFLYTAGSGIVSGVNLVIYDTASSFTLDSALDVGNATLGLYTTGSDTQNGGAITANKLDSYSAGGLSLGSTTNSFAEIGTIGNVGAGGIAVTDAAALTVTGIISTGSASNSTIGLITTGTGNGLTINGHLTGGTVDLVSAGTIAEGTSGYIDAGTLEGSSHGNVTLLGWNQVGALGNFTTGTGAFDLYDFTALDVTGTLNTATHTIKLVDEVGNLEIDGTLEGGTVTLDSIAGEVQGAGTVDAKLLNVTADTGIDLDGANDIVAIGTDTTSSGTNVIDQH